MSHSPAVSSLVENIWSLVAPIGKSLCMSAAELLHIRVKYFTMRWGYGSKGGIFMTHVIYAYINIFTVAMYFCFFKSVIDLA